MTGFSFMVIDLPCVFRATGPCTCSYDRVAVMGSSPVVHLCCVLPARPATVIATPTIPVSLVSKDEHALAKATLPGRQPPSPAGV